MTNQENSAHSYSEGSEIKADFTIDHDDFKAVQGAEVIRLTDGTRFIREDVASKTMAKYVESKDEEIQQLKEALKWALNSLSSYYDDPSSETFDKYNNARKLIELNKPEK